MLYLVWRACERWGIRPWAWDEVEPQRRRDLVAYEMIRYEEDIDRSRRLL